MFLLCFICLSMDTSLVMMGRDVVIGVFAPVARDRLFFVVGGFWFCVERVARGETFSADLHLLRRRGFVVQGSFLAGSPPVGGCFFLNVPFVSWRYYYIAIWNICQAVL